MGTTVRLVIGNKTFSSWSLRPWMMMTVMGLDFDEVMIPLRQPDTKSRILAHSPAGTVPVLIDGDAVVWETLAILEYLADRHPTAGVWPADVHARAHARAISSEMHAGFTALRSACAMNITKRFKARDRGPEVAADVARITAIFSDARERFGANTGQPFLFGAFCAADAMFAPVVTRLNSYSIAVDPVSQAYVDAVLAHPAYQTWLHGAATETAVFESFDHETVAEHLRPV